MYEYYTYTKPMPHADIPVKRNTCFVPDHSQGKGYGQQSVRQISIYIYCCMPAVKLTLEDPAAAAGRVLMQNISIVSLRAI